MIRYTLLFWLLTASGLQAQFSISSPVVAEGPFAITDTVFMATNGDDTNPGTMELPVKTFAKALQLLPFGVAGVNGGHGYGLIRLLPGMYTEPGGFAQHANNWQNGNVYKNVSVEGLGEVQLGGTPDEFLPSHAMRLMGSHIFVRNISIKYADGIGLLINRDNLDDPRLSDVLIEEVEVDSVGSFAMLLQDIDAVEVRHSSALRAARPGSESLSSPCQWPSGIKFHFSTQCYIHHSVIAGTRGEGLNFHNVQNGLAEENVIHDNGLNIYNDNSKNIIVRKNLIFNTPGNQNNWRNCPADTNPILPPSGMMMANEGSCRGLGASYQGCATHCLLIGEKYPNVDSVFVYNNVFQNVGAVFLFWEGVTSQFGINCIQNVFIYHNTCISSLGDLGAANSRGIVDFFFPAIHNTITNSNFAIGQNIQIRNNIFLRNPQSDPYLPPVRMVRDNIFPVPLDVTFDYNRWSESHSFMGAHGEVFPGMPSDLPLLLDSLHLIQPCVDQPGWIFSVPEIGETWLGEDYLFEARNEGITNAGALEYRESCELISSVEESAFEEAWFEVFPNPVSDGYVNIISKKPFNAPLEIFLYNELGQMLGQWQFDASQIKPINLALPESATGFLILELKSGEWHAIKKLVR